MAYTLPLTAASDAGCSPTYSAHTIQLDWHGLHRIYFSAVHKRLPGGRFMMRSKRRDVACRISQGFITAT